MRPEFYQAIVERLQKEFNLSIDRSEHIAITEFFEGPLPLFKLILASNKDSEEFSMLVSFQIQLDAPTAIIWFTRIRQLDPNLSVTASYIKDADGVSYVGEDAEVVLMFMVEQDVISTFIQSNKDPDDILNQSVNPINPSPAKTYNNYRKALKDFKHLKKSKEDMSH